MKIPKDIVKAIGELFGMSEEEVRKAETEANADDRCTCTKCNHKEDKYFDDKDTRDKFNAKIRELKQELIDVIKSRFPEIKEHMPSQMLNDKTNPSTINYMMNKRIRSRKLEEQVAISAVAYLAHLQWMNRYEEEHNVK